MGRGIGDEHRALWVGLVLLTSCLLAWQATAAPPANDVCSTAQVLTEGVEAGPFSTVEATDDYAPQCVVLDGPDTVHEITLSQDSAALVTITPESPDWDLVAALRTGDACTVDTDLSCVPGGSGPRYLNQPRLAAGTYDVIVDGAFGASGSYDIRYDTGLFDTTFGYWIVDTTGTFESIRDDPGAVQVDIPLSSASDPLLGDEWSVPLTLPFSFEYYGTAHSTVYADSNLFLTFGPPPTGAEAWSPDCPLDHTAPSDVIAVFWDDGMSHEDGPSALWTKVEGVAPHRRFVIEYADWWILATVGGYSYMLDVDVNQQVVLYEDGDIELRYGPRKAATTPRGCGSQETGCSATIGIQGPAPQYDTDSAGCQMDGTFDGRVIRFVHPTAASPVPRSRVPALPGPGGRLVLLAILVAAGSVLLGRRVRRRPPTR